MEEERQNGQIPSLVASATRLPEGSALACAIDLSTTGYDPGNDQVLQLSVVMFAYDPVTKDVIGIVDRYDGMREPSCRVLRNDYRRWIPSNAELSGKSIDEKKVRSMIRSSSFIVAHNASFAKSFITRFLPSSANVPWYCTYRGIDWKKRGIGIIHRTLSSLLSLIGIQFAQADGPKAGAAGVVSLLATPGPNGENNLAELLERQKPVRAMLTAAGQKNKKAFELQKMKWSFAAKKETALRATCVTKT